MQKNNSEGLLLLDTHIWLWLLEGYDILYNSGVLENIEKAASHSKLRVSLISLWEVAMLEAKGRIRFNVNCLDWLTEALKAPGLSILEMTPEIAVLSAKLPGDFHGDPADRIIIASAITHNASLVTKDKKIIKYGKDNDVKIVPL